MSGASRGARGATGGDCGRGAGGVAGGRPGRRADTGHLVAIAQSPASTAPGAAETRSPGHFVQKLNIQQCGRAFKGCGELFWNIWRVSSAPESLQALGGGAPLLQLLEHRFLRLGHHELIEGRIEAVWVLNAADRLSFGVAHLELARQQADEYVLFVRDAAFPAPFSLQFSAYVMRSSSVSLYRLRAASAMNMSISSALFV